jgi:hypothetical protein
MAGLFFLFFLGGFFSQVSALDVAWTIIVVSQIFSYPICNFCIFFFNFDAQILKIHFLYFPTAGAYISNLYPIFSNKKEII